MASLSYAASSGTVEEFDAEYTPEQATRWSSVTGQTLLHLALSNTDPHVRAQIAGRLLDDGADPAAVFGPEGYTTVHVLLGRRRHDAAVDAPLLRRLLDGGADVNAASTTTGTPVQTLASQGKFSDAELGPFYDVLFARPDLDLRRPGKGGRSTLESVRLMAARRPELVARAEAYARQRGEPDER